MKANVIRSIDDTNWTQFDSFGVPFLDINFFRALEASSTVGGDSGWSPLYIEDKESLLFSFIKNHSYGEYIFDWDWANFYHKHNIPYYPKLTSMIPFTSATTPHFLGRASKKIMNEYEEFFQKNSFSSSHFLFLTEKEIHFFKSYGYIIRHSFQYHFINKGYESFSHFLSTLKPKKAKQIRKERKFSDDISFHQYTGENLTEEHGVEMYKFYLSTIKNKGAIAYLNESFFKNVFKNLRSNVLYVQAKKAGCSIAGAFYLFNSDRLYGRYWGAKEEIKNLHFELCYYQSIEFCIKNKIDVFEAGAQGEHKIARGFRPILTYSAHKLKIPELHKAIEGYIINEKNEIDYLVSILNTKLPFKFLESE